MGSLGRMGSPSPAQSCNPQHPLSLGTVPTRSPGDAEEAATPQPLQQRWERTVFILNSQHLSPGIAGWSFQAGTEPKEKPFLQVFGSVWKDNPSWQ